MCSILSKIKHIVIVVQLDHLNRLWIFFSFNVYYFDPLQRVTCDLINQMAYLKGGRLKWVATHSFRHSSAMRAANRMIRTVALLSLPARCPEQKANKLLPWTNYQRQEDVKVQSASKILTRPFGFIFWTSWWNRGASERILVAQLLRLFVAGGDKRRWGTFARCIYF